MKMRIHELDAFAPLYASSEEDLQYHCGSGYTAGNCQAMRWSLHILDYSPTSIQQCIKRSIYWPSCDTFAHAKSETARKVIMYLIPAYHLEIVDANYGSRDSKFASLLYKLEQESYLTIRERITGIPDEPAYSCLLVEQDDMAFENASADIPTITPAPVRTRSPRSRRFASPRNVVVCQAGPYPVFYKVPKQQRMGSRRARNA